MSFLLFCYCSRTVISFCFPFLRIRSVCSFFNFPGFIISDPLFFIYLWDWFHISIHTRNGNLSIFLSFLMILALFNGLFYVVVLLCGIVLISYLYYNYCIIICKSATSHKFLRSKLYIFHKNRCKTDKPVKVSQKKSGIFLCLLSHNTAPHKKEAGLFLPKDLLLFHNNL